MTNLDDALINLSDDQLRALNRKILAILKIRRDQKNLLAKTEFRIGEDVWFTHSKTGRRVEGSIHKICRKNIQISEIRMGGRTIWTVPPAMVKHKVEKIAEIAGDFREIELDDEL